MVAQVYMHGAIAISYLSAASGARSPQIITINCQYRFELMLLVFGDYLCTIQEASWESDAQRSTDY